jgi:hypothetical protein
VTSPFPHSLRAIIGDGFSIFYTHYLVGLGFC